MAGDTQEILNLKAEVEKLLITCGQVVVVVGWSHPRIIQSPEVAEHPGLSLTAASLLQSPSAKPMTFPPLSICCLVAAGHSKK